MTRRDPSEKLLSGAEQVIRQQLRTSSSQQRAVGSLLRALLPQQLFFGYQGQQKSTPRKSSSSTELFLYKCRALLKQWLFPGYWGAHLFGIALAQSSCSISAGHYRTSGYPPAIGARTYRYFLHLIFSFREEFVIDLEVLEASKIGLRCVLSYGNSQKV